MWTDLFAAITREVSVQEPVMTWNLFLTIFLVPICSALTTAAIVGHVNRKYKLQADHAEEVAVLLKRIEEEKLKALLAWQQEHATKICKVKEKVDGIYDELNVKVDKDECRDLRAAMK